MVKCCTGLVDLGWIGGFWVECYWIRGVRERVREGKGRHTVVQNSKPNVQSAFLEFELDVSPEIEHKCGESGEIAAAYTSPSSAYVRT